MAEKCYLPRSALEISAEAPKDNPASSPSKVLSRSRGSSKTVPVSGSHKGMFISPLLIKSLYCSQAKRKRKVNLGSVQAKCLPGSSKFLSPFPQNPEGGSSSRLLDGEDRPDRRLSSCACKSGVSKISGFPLEEQNLCLHLPSLHPVSGAGSFSRSNELPFAPLQSSGNLMSS